MDGIARVPLAASPTTKDVTDAAHSEPSPPGPSTLPGALDARVSELIRQLGRRPSYHDYERAKRVIGQLAECADQYERAIARLTAGVRL